MFKNIVVSSVRNLIRNKSFSLINIAGLALSMSLGMLILMITQDQLSFDNFHIGKDSIFRINTHLQHSDWGTLDFASAPLPVGQVIRDDYPLADRVVRVNRELRGDLESGTVRIPVSGLFVDPAFLEVFNFPLQQGDLATALSSPRSLVLTNQTAIKMFGESDPMGQTVTLGKLGLFSITGVLGDPPGKTHLEFELLCPMATLSELERSGVMSHSTDNWSAFHDNYVYVKLKKEARPADVEEKLSDISRRYGTGLHSDGKEIAYSFYLQPLNRITPGPELSGQMGRGVPSFFLVFLGALGGIVLLLSIFNFTNLTIAKSLYRAREVGIRKVVGARRYQVFLQFIGEAVVFSIVALVFSYAFLQVLKFGFLKLSLLEEFSIATQENLALYGLFTLMAVLVGILAGLLPAAYLSAFSPSKVLKDVQNLKVYSRLTFRKLLMITQFTLTVVFVIVVTVVYQQVDFMVSSDYGIHQKGNLNLNLKGVPFEKIADEIRRIPGVVRVGGVSHKLGTFADGSGNYTRNQDDGSMVIRHFMVDNNYIENIAPQFLAGHNFREEEQADREREIILNETAARQLGFEQPSESLDQVIYAEDTLPLHIVGVVKDFHFRPMNNRIGPMAFRYNLKAVNYLSAHIATSQRETVINELEATWKRFDPDHPAEYTMMEDEIDDAYRESGMNDALVILGYITFLVITLSCLGMMGMAMYAAQVRVKEVGIRKVMGASVRDVLRLLSGSFLTMILIAVLVGVPISYVTSESFLEGFAYRIQITPTTIAVAIFLIAGTGLFIVWTQTIRVAASNPTKWLRNE